MRDEWASSEPIHSQGLAQSSYGSKKRSGNPFLASKAMRLKLSGQLSREVSERRQVGDAEEMFAKKSGDKPWWRNVGMEEGV